MEDNTIKLDLSQTTEDSPTGQAQEAEPVQETPPQIEVLPKEELKVETPTNEAGDYVINLSKPVEDGVQERETEEVPVQSETKISEELGEEVRSESPKDESPALELVNEEETPEIKVTPQAPEPQATLPEGIDKLVDFMKDTGLQGQEALQAYSDLSKNPDDLDQRTLLTDYYKATKPFLNGDQIQKQLNKKYTYDAESTEPDEIEEKSIALQEELYTAKQYLTNRKEKYYTDLKLRQQNSLPPEALEAVEFYNNYKSEQEKVDTRQSNIAKTIDNTLNDEFKGFDFKVGENKYRYNVTNRDSLKKTSTDLTKAFKQYFSEEGQLVDPQGYAKAVYGAQNIEKVAAHFYEQGKADSIKASAKNSKNIDMGSRTDGTSITNPSAQTARVVSNTSSSNNKNPMRIPGWNN